MPKTSVGSRVRRLRSERGFSQAAPAQMLEISQRALPALGRSLDIDEHRSTVLPHLVKEM